MNMIGRQTKAPGEQISWTIDYAADLVAGDALTGTTATVSGPDAAFTIVYAIFTDDGATTHIAKVMTAGGTNGATYTVTVTTTTRNGEILQDAFTVKIKA